MRVWLLALETCSRGRLRGAAQTSHDHQDVHTAATSACTPAATPSVPNSCVSCVSSCVPCLYIVAGTVCQCVTDTVRNVCLPRPCPHARTQPALQLVHTLHPQLAGPEDSLPLQWWLAQGLCGGLFSGHGPGHLQVEGGWLIPNPQSPKSSGRAALCAPAPAAWNTGAEVMPCACPRKVSYWPQIPGGAAFF